MSTSRKIWIDPALVSRTGLDPIRWCEEIDDSQSIADEAVKLAQSFYAAMLHDRKGLMMLGAFAGLGEHIIAVRSDSYSTPFKVQITTTAKWVNPRGVADGG